MVEGARLESVCRGNPTEGSNPSLSATFSRDSSELWLASQRRRQIRALVAPDDGVAARTHAASFIQNACAFMPIRRVCEAHVPFVRGGAEYLVRTLVAQLEKHGCGAELVSVPFNWFPKRRNPGARGRMASARSQ